MTTKRAYKLQEFVAHTSNVNCLKIGRKSSRILLTGGEDHKVNLWAIGKPNAILSLSGHSSPVESVNFDPSEVIVAGGAASGTIKLWDLEEAKVVRSLTGHRSNCMSIDFHPFGEFFASGSLDTNLKIWDIRRKSCIHTYKGHTRGVNVLRFTPDGKWVVSGGEDNSVKIWDLTAGKLLNDFKLHEGQIQCLDFHPNEFLLATGSADKTVKFWDLETFEMIGSSGPETAQSPNNSPQVPLSQQMLRYTGGVRAMTFNSDGKSIFCGLHESMKVLSWEPIRCHDIVDVGWSKLCDLHVHDGKLLGCSYNQTCVGIWVVDLSKLEPFTVRNAEKKSNISNDPPLQRESNLKATFTRLSISKDSAPTSPKKSVQSSKPPIVVPPVLPRKIPSKPLPAPSITSNKSEDSDMAPPLSRTTSARESANNIPPHASLSRSRSKETACFAPVVVSRTDLKEANVSHSRTRVRETTLVTPVVLPTSNPRVEIETNTASRENKDLVMLVPKATVRIGTRRKHTEDDSDRDEGSRPGNRENIESSAIATRQRRGYSTSGVSEKPLSSHDGNLEPINSNRTGAVGTAPVQSYNIRYRAARTPIVIWDRSKHAPMHEGLRSLVAGKETESASDEDAIADLMENHQNFLTTGQTRLTKLQVIHRLWAKNDFKGVINALQKMSDLAVSADFVSTLMEKSNVITLDFCTSLLPLITNLLESRFDRHINIALEILLKLLKTFGTMIYSTVTASTSVGVDLHAEERLERCNMCFIELEKLKTLLPPITRRGGTIGKSAQDLNLFLQDINKMR
ncbi:hypothetical protein LUZ62_012384 [Rhynchospora pubera]|uniref:Katanin p80 WD40 repeat-containing subunit B1 homolog n=1 Tax=Rhynchospora pubera TaxID=906938 RepID=A0AAV8BPD9_9POAL|nr:hypothetical protein LUZ62_012384 [Rhynchospora pubera]